SRACADKVENNPGGRRRIGTFWQDAIGALPVRPGDSRGLIGGDFRMSQCRFKASEPALRLVPLTLLAAAALWAAPALAQTSGPKAKAPPAPGQTGSPSAPATQGPAQTVIPAAKAPEPTFDEGTARRIAAAMLSYSALEVRGGWPALPATAKLAPSVSIPDLMLLRESPLMHDDRP